MNNIIRKVTLLTTASAALVAQTACETDANEIDTSGGTPISVMTCIFSPTDTIRVHIASSVAYDSHQKEAAVDDAYVTMSVNDEPLWTTHITNGQTDAAFPPQKLTTDDKVTISAEIGDNGKMVRGSALVMSRVPIERVDTITSDDKETLHISLSMRDPQETTDYYQITVHRLAYQDGIATDTVIKCKYKSNVFSDLTGNMTSAAPIGLFVDERLPVRGGGRNTLHLSAPWADIKKPLKEDGADSTVISVRLLHLSDDFYNFMNTRQQSQNFLLLPVFGTSAVTSNTDGGYGIVACEVYDEKRFTLTTY